MKVGVAFGGRSGEHEVSIMSARSVVDAVVRSGFEPVALAIAKSGRWVLPRDAERVFRRGYVVDGDGPPLVFSPGPSGGQIWALEEGAFSSLTVDVVIPVLHGPFGEDGTVQGFLELMDVPYVGAGVAASAAGMDKALMKALFRERGIPVVDYEVILRSRWEAVPGEVLEEVESRFRYPVFVKPANLGSSVGVTKVEDRRQLESGLGQAALYDRKIIVERAVNAREIECSVLGNDRPLVSVPGEVEPSRGFYDYEAKYSGGTALKVPAELERGAAEKIRELAARAFKAIDCSGLARVDFFLEKDTGDIYVNEINTMPGFTNTSMYPRLWEASGISYPDLVRRLIDLALQRHADKKRNATSLEAGT